MGGTLVHGSLMLILLLETFFLGCAFSPLIGAGIIISHPVEWVETELFAYAKTAFSLILVFMIGQMAALVTLGQALRTKAPNWLLPFAAWRSVVLVSCIGLMIAIGISALHIRIGEYDVSAEALLYPLMIVGLLVGAAAIAAVLRARLIWRAEAKADVDGWKVDIIGQIGFEVPGRGVGIHPSDNIFHAGF